MTDIHQLKQKNARFIFLTILETTKTHDI